MSRYIPARRVDLRPKRASPSRVRTLLLAGVLMALATASNGAWAWGAQGHRIIARLAQAHLTPAARAMVDDLLDAPDRSLEDIAPWADTVRVRGTAPLHYVNLDRQCRYDAARDCPDGKCLPAAIDHYRSILADPAQTRADRVQALKWVVHLVGEATQPLHAGGRGDRGGNGYQVQWQGRGTNLHALWDTALVRELDTIQTDTPLPPPGPFEPVAWVEESCRIAAQPGFYPDTHTPGPEYQARWQAWVRARLLLGGARLAATLNTAAG